VAGCVSPTSEGPLRPKRAGVVVHAGSEKRAQGGRPSERKAGGTPCEATPAVSSSRGFQPTFASSDLSTLIQSMFSGSTPFSAAR